uniref:C-type lectin domain-containing protein n=1 Tax=Laticauda laticaudata TaxID=8630 RepID=A0A8C5S6B5_LATLA
MRNFKRKTCTISCFYLRNWKNGEPNTYQNREEDCGQVWINGEWNDYICSSESFYVCEKPKPSTPKAASKRP